MSRRCLVTARRRNGLIFHEDGRKAREREKRDEVGIFQIWGKEKGEKESKALREQKGIIMMRHTPGARKEKGGWYRQDIEIDTKDVWCLVELV